MTDRLPELHAQLDRIQRAFDDSYREPLAERATLFEDLLAIEIAGRPYALRVRELSGLYVECAVTALPDAVPELLGLAAVRGGLVAVYDLATLLGCARSDAARLIVVFRGAAVAFAAGALVGQLRVEPSAIAKRESGGEPWAVEVVRESERTRPILELAGLVRVLEQRFKLAQNAEVG